VVEVTRLFLVENTAVPSCSVWTDAGPETLPFSVAKLTRNAQSSM
jgi:hypothetical protein